MAKHHNQPPAFPNERTSRFVWQSSDITVIRVGDEKLPVEDAEPDKPAPCDEAPAAESKAVTDDQEQKDKP